MESASVILQPNGNVSEYDSSYGTHEVIVTVITATILGVFTLSTVVGNVFVIAAILLERNLRSVGNYLVFSLAVADLMVACLVMPLGAVSVVSGQWTLGAILCDVWTIADVLCCTASILHLLAIAMDRYWAVTDVNYIHNRNARRIGVMIFGIWAVAGVVSLAPVLGWKDPDFLRRIEEEKSCLISQDVAYQVFATFATFYVPLALILMLYWRIFQVARKRIRRHGKPGNEVVLRLKSTSGSNRSLPVPSTNELVTNFSSEVSTTSPHASPEKGTSNNGITNINDKDSAKVEILPKKKLHLKESIESKRERKAAKTLAIITGVFVICWLPFFVVALLSPLCESCRDNLPKIVMDIFLWLGYINSCVNPIIYTIFSPDFRAAFKRMLIGKKSNRSSPKGPTRSVIVLLPMLLPIVLGGGSNGGQSNSWRKQDGSGSYKFSYEIADPWGGKNSRQESGDAWGNKAGSYSLYDTDGRMRVVDYVADKQGFRAQVRTNEPGVVSHVAANAPYVHSGGHGGHGGHGGYGAKVGHVGYSHSPRKW